MPHNDRGVLRPRRVLGADRLFGMTTGYPFWVKAVGKTSIMEFSKEQYVNLLHSDRIYMLNFFNYLSLRAQRPIEAICDYGDGGIRSRLSLLIGIMTSPGSNKIYIKASDEALSRYCSTDEGTLTVEKRYGGFRGSGMHAPWHSHTVACRIFIMAFHIFFAIFASRKDIVPPYIQCFVMGII